MDKRIVIGTSLCAGLVLTMGASSEVHASANEIGEVTASSLNLRSSEPGKHNVILGGLKKGDKVTILGDAGEGFVKVKTSKGTVGKCSKSYLKVKNISSTSANVEKMEVYNTDKVNIRSGPGRKYSKVGTLSKGTKVDVLSSSSGWHKIKFNGNKEAYCSANYLKSTNKSSTSSTSSSVKKMEVYNTDKVNVRSGPGTKYSNIGTLAKGTKVDVLSSANGWHKIKFNGNKEAYCSDNYLKLTSSNTSSNTAKKKYNNIVSMFRTYYKVGNDRAKNVELAADRINGTKVKRGDVFSFNKTVGKYIKENGWVKAPVMQNGQITGSAYAGGACQVATALYNCALEGGFININAETHTGKVSYIEAGLDAVVSSSMDMQFKNTYSEDVVIYMNYNAGVLTVKIQSENPLLGGKTYKKQLKKVGKQVELSVYEKKGLYSKRVYRRVSRYV